VVLIEGLRAGRSFYGLPGSTFDRAYDPHRQSVVKQLGSIARLDYDGDRPLHSGIRLDIICKFFFDFFKKVSKNYLNKTENPSSPYPRALY
jgi:hypothetical protein